MTMAEEIKDCAKAVFDELGTGHSEAVYESAMVVEMGLRDIGGPVVRQVPCPILYKGYTVGVGYIDIMIGDFLLVELKSVAKLTSRDELQVRKYLLGSGMAHGLLINFTQAPNTSIKLNNGKIESWEEVEVVEIFIKPSGIIEVPFNVNPQEVKKVWDALPINQKEIIHDKATSAES